jgi:hypothetical protein
MTALHKARTLRGVQAGFHGVKICSAEIGAVLWPSFDRQRFIQPDHGFASPLALEEQERKPVGKSSGG